MPKKKREDDVSRIARIFVRHIRKLKRLDALASGRKTTAARKKARGILRDSFLKTMALQLGCAGLSLDKMSAPLGKAFDRNEEYIRKKIRGCGFPPHLQPYRDAAIALYWGEFRKAREIANDLLPGPQATYIRCCESELKHLSDAERQRAVLEVFFGLKP